MTPDHDIIEEYLSKPYWIIDVLPHQVPADGGGQYFAIEKALLRPPHIDAIRRRMANLVLKLNCYLDVDVCLANDDMWQRNLSPNTLGQWIAQGFALRLLLPDADAMITFDSADHYMTIYNPDEATLALVRELAAAEGLHVWQPASDKA